MNLTITLSPDQMKELAQAVAQELGGTITTGKSFHTVPEAAKLLGVSTRTIARRIEAGTIPRVPGLNSVRIPATWLNKQQTTA